MTSPERNTALAKAMGYTVQAVEIAHRTWYALKTIDKKRVAPNIYCTSDEAWRDAPVFDTDPSASRELMQWLAMDGQRWKRFEAELARLLWPEWAKYTEPPQEVSLKTWTTAPLPLIRDAAVMALGTETKEE